MRNLMKIPVLLSLVLLLLVRCSSDKDAYFSRPSWLEPPIYTVLEDKGKFTNYLKCVDRTLYATSLKASGYLTVFAPNDSAFNVFLQSKNYASVNDIPDSTVNRIVAYSLVYNKYTYDHLTDILYNGWDSLSSVKKKTNYYETIHQETYKGNPIWAFDMAAFAVGENNYKFLPFYLTRMFEKNRSKDQAAQNYNIFYPSTYTGRNVQNANILESDIVAENGIVHIVDKVLEPLPTIENLVNDADYSDFKSLVNKTGSTGEPYFVSYAYSKTASDYFKTAYPDKSIDKVYLKSYALPYNLNAERYGSSNSQAEQGGFTLFAPTNAAVQKFYNEKLINYYPGGIQTVSAEVLYYFIKAHMIDELVWPDDYKNSMNSNGEFFNSKGATGSEFNKDNYKKITPASNGFFYGSDNYIKSRYFETVFTEILLNPSYSLLNTSFSEYFESTLKEELLKCELNGYTQENYTVLLPSDELLRADGFSWSWISASNKYGFTHSQSGSALGNFDVATRIQRLVKSHIFKRIKNDDIDCSITSFKTDPAFESAYVYTENGIKYGLSYAVNEYGDMVRYFTNSAGIQKIQMLGNADESAWVTATPSRTFLNGQVFTIDKMLQYSPRTTNPSTEAGYKTQALIKYLNAMAASNTSVSSFVSYLVQCLKGETDELAGLSSDMVLTIFMPNNAAITKAIANKDLPTYAAITNADSVNARNRATKFILYHIVKGKVFVDDGLKYIMPNKEKIVEETWPTVLKDVVDNTYLAVSKDQTTGILTVSTQSSLTQKKYSTDIKTLPVVRGFKHSNYFGANAVLHEISSYLTYKKVQ